MTVSLKEIDRVEIVTLQDNYVDLIAQDNSPVVQRAVPLVGVEIKNSVLAEHGFSSFITTTQGMERRSMLFDFGFSEKGAAQNADALNIDLTKVEEMALSHGHLDHVGGIKAMSAMTGKKDIPLVLHPAAFRNRRYMKVMGTLNIYFPSFGRENALDAGLAVVETAEPYNMLDQAACFLGGIPRISDFEKGAPNMFFEEDGTEIHDSIEDDSAMIFNVRGKGLVIVSGCAHAGIINTVNHAKAVTGVDRIHAVMGGFHLSGADMDKVIKPTAEALKALKPQYVIPTHCTGRKAVNYMEQELGDAFILNMSGTTLTFSA